MEYIETLIKIGGPILALVWYLLRMFIRAELRAMSEILQREQRADLKDCSREMINKIEFKADAKQLERLFEIVEEFRAQIVDVLVDARIRERDHR